MDAKKELAGRLLECRALDARQIQTIFEDYIILRKTDPRNNALSQNIERFLWAKKVDGLSAKSIDNYRMILYSVLRSFFGWQLMEEAIERSPMLKIKSLKIDTQGLRKALSVEELERLRNACTGYKEKALLEFLVSSGCRVGEVTNIGLDSIDFMERSVKVIGKGNKERTVYFSVRAKLMIEEYAKQRKGGAALFAYTRSPYPAMKARGIQYILKKIGERAGLSRKIFPHIFRHTFATQAISNGMEITALQRLLGHEELSTTQAYINLSQETVRRAYDRFIS